MTNSEVTEKLIDNFFEKYSNNNVVVKKEKSSKVIKKTKED